MIFICETLPRPFSWLHTKVPPLYSTPHSSSSFEDTSSASALPRLLRWRIAITAIEDLQLTCFCFLTVEHSTTGTSTPRRRRRPDLSTFFATLNEITPSPTGSRSRPNAVPVPGDVSAAFRSLAEAFDVMRRGTDSLPVYDDRDQGLGDADPEHSLITQMIRTLLQEAETPPREVEGVSEEFCDGMSSNPCPSALCCCE